ncbi:hypothetical protein CLV62_11755 [Dysgonomonas alginatilytica]|uniref:Uncharacterized protein n=1 Tax=Dysgonomonas alginatilytica TaxID=1605892 RepID=A0A2V3PNU4_9BACT|nr:hypothetical protein CLV62_11755 [Dysgonomonas alginatilytica]
MQEWIKRKYYLCVRFAINSILYKLGIIFVHVNCTKKSRN